MQPEIENKQQMRRFYSPPELIADGMVILGAEETRHLRDVLRLRADDEASVFDGEGREYHCTVEEVKKTQSVLRVVREVSPASPESPLEIILAAAILPGDRFEFTVQKAVELGVVRLKPLFTRRCEVKPGGGRRSFERWQKIALESAKQCGRARAMTIDEPVGFGQFVAEASKAASGTSRILFSERGGSGFETIKSASSVVAVFGPKGGWDDAELAAAADSGFQIITFGGRIMRAETAAIAMTAILQHRFGDLK